MSFKKSNIIFDTVPLKNSTNAISSGAVANALEKGGGIPIYKVTARGTLNKLTISNGWTNGLQGDNRLRITIPAKKNGQFIFPRNFNEYSILNFKAYDFYYNNNPSYIFNDIYFDGFMYQYTPTTIESETYQNPYVYISNIYSQYGHSSSNANYLYCTIDYLFILWNDLKNYNEV